MNIEAYREQIDRLDDEIARLFCERMAIVSQIARQKKQTGKAVADKARERAILNRITGQASPELDSYLRLLFNTIIGISRTEQSLLNASRTSLSDAIAYARNNTPEQFPKKAAVGCQGIEGAYSHLAAEKLFPYPDIMYFNTFESVFQAVKQGLCRYGLLPIENSTFGSVSQVYDLMKKYDFYIAKSVRLLISHCLLMTPGGQQRDIQEIVSHEQALGQCSQFIQKHPHIKITVCENTAMAAQYVAEAASPHIAAISSYECAPLYGLSVVNREIQNSDYNYTRFICISKDMEIYPGANRTSIMLSIAHRPGSLFEVLSRLAALGVNLIKLESRPIAGRDFEFMFYFDFDAGAQEPAMLHLFDEMAVELEQFKFIGCYSEDA